MQARYLPITWTAKIGWFALGFFSFSFTREMYEKSDYQKQYIATRARLDTILGQPETHEAEILQIYEWLMLPRGAAIRVQPQHLRVLDQDYPQRDALAGYLLPDGESSKK